MAICNRPSRPPFAARTGRSAYRYLHHPLPVQSGAFPGIPAADQLRQYHHRRPHLHACRLDAGAGGHAAVHRLAGARAAVLQQPAGDPEQPPQWRHFHGDCRSIRLPPGPPIGAGPESNHRGAGKNQPARQQPVQVPLTPGVGIHLLGQADGHPGNPAQEADGVLLRHSRLYRAG